MTNGKVSEQTQPPSPMQAVFAATQATLNEINAKLDLLIEMQHEMRFGLCCQFADLCAALDSINNDLRQIHQGIKPDSFQSRLMRMGQ